MPDSQPHTVRQSPLLDLEGAVEADPPDAGVAAHYGSIAAEQRRLVAAVERVEHGQAARGVEGGQAGGESRGPADGEERCPVFGETAEPDQVELGGVGHQSGEGNRLRDSVFHRNQLGAGPCQGEHRVSVHPGVLDVRQ